MKKISLLLTSILLILFLAACGGESEKTGSNNGTSSGGTVDIVASNWDFDQSEYKASAGEVTVNLSNKEGYHGITIDNTDVKIDGEGSATVKLEPGEYIIRCSIPCGEGHQEMTAKLLVE